jgi:hypothetical protein
MTAENLGIILGPVFVNLLNPEPLSIIPMAQFFNQVCHGMLADNTYTHPFQQSYPAEAQALKKHQLEELELESKVLTRMRETYADKLNHYETLLAQDKAKLSALKGQIFKGKSAQKAMLKYSIEQKQQILNMLKADDRNCNVAKLNEIAMEMASLKLQFVEDKPSKLLVFTKRKQANVDVTALPQQKNLAQLAAQKKKKRPIFKG